MCNWYYDLTDDNRHSQDPEGNLVWLCGRHAQMYSDEIEFASTDSLHNSECWMCMEEEMESVFEKILS